MIQLLLSYCQVNQVNQEQKQPQQQLQVVAVVVVMAAGLCDSVSAHEAH